MTTHTQCCGHILHYVVTNYGLRKKKFGQTGRTLSHPLKEHKQALRSANSSASAVVEHAISSGYTIAWDEALVRDSNLHLHP